MSAWEVKQTENTVHDKHIVPIGDAIEHTPDDCPCGSRDELWAMEDGTEFWVVTHNSLDGRELTEPGYAVPSGARPIWGQE